jgi:hypothetical protein
VFNFFFFVPPEIQNDFRTFDGRFGAQGRALGPDEVEALPAGSLLRLQR